MTWGINRLISENQSIRFKLFNFFVVTSRSSFMVGFIFQEYNPFFSLYTFKMDLSKNVSITLTKIVLWFLSNFMTFFRYFKVTMIRKRWYPMCYRSTSGLVSSGSGPRLGPVDTEPWGQSCTAVFFSNCSSPNTVRKANS